jgi:phosphatidylserine decarboxylase
MIKFNLPDKKSNAFQIAKPGLPVIFSCAFITALFALLGFSTVTLICLGITLFVCFFFRDPQRAIPEGDRLLASPADGKIIFTGHVDGKHFFQGECLKISIFMSVFNVHVNRIPHDGSVTKIWYFPGKFFSANLDKASDKNEHNAVFIETPQGDNICMVQIAGLIARRIICNISGGDAVKQGERFGMICFGSRVDLYLPPDFELAVKRGDKVHAGESIIGYLK